MRFEGLATRHARSIAFQLVVVPHATSQKSTDGETLNYLGDSSRFAVCLAPF